MPLSAHDDAHRPRGEPDRRAAADAPSDGHGTRLLVFLTVVGLALRLVRLGHQSLWIDETMSFGWVAEIHARGFGSLLKDIHGPLHALAIYAMSHVSASEWSLRLPSAIAGTLSIPALGLLGRALWGRRIGLTAAALLAFSPFALYYSQECRNYAFNILFAIVALGAALAFSRQPGWRRAALFASAEFLGILSNLNTVFFLLGLNSWLLVRLWGQRRALRRWVACHAILGALLAPYAWEVTHQVRPERLVGVETNFGQKQPLRGETTLHALAVPYTAFAFAAGYSLGPTLAELRLDPRAPARTRHWPALLLAGFGFGPALVTGLLARRAPAGRGMLLVPALSTLGFTLWLAATNMKPYNARYLAVALPAFLLLVALGLWRLPRRWVAAAGLAAAVASLWSCWNYLFVPRYARDDTRAAVGYVALHSQPEDFILQISLDGPLGYYQGLGARPVHAALDAGTSPEAAQRYVEMLAREARVLWYLECRPEAYDPRGHLRQALGARASGATETGFTGIKVHRYEMPAAG